MCHNICGHFQNVQTIVLCPGKFFLYFLHSDIVVEKHNHSEIPDCFGRNVNDDRCNYFEKWKLLIHVVVKNIWYSIKDFLYTKVNLCNCSLLIIFELRLKNPRQPDFAGTPSTPQSKALRTELWSQFVRSFLSRVQLEKSFLRWKGNLWHRWTSFDWVFWNANKEESLHDLMIYSYSMILDSSLEKK